MTFTGGLYGESKEELLSRASIFVMPTWFPNECFPLSILEAFKFGIPVISTFEGAIPDMIDDGKNGYLVEAKDPEALSTKIKKFIDEPDLVKEMGKNAQKKFQENYTFTKFEERFIKVLNGQL